MTRDEARQLFKDSGLTYAVNSPENLRRLITLINSHMIASGVIDGTLRMRRSTGVNKYGKGTAELRCRAFYFDSREAVTFNPNGFVGFAGWAADENVAPILDGFAEWCREMAAVTVTA